MNWRARLVVAAIGWLSLASWVSADEGEQIWQGLMDCAPSVPQSESRMAAVQALDDWIGRPNSEQSPELAAYYRRAVDRVIQLLGTDRPKSGMRYFQLYSSSVIIQTPSCTFAIDLDQGPNEDLDKTPEEAGTTFCMTDEQVAKLTELIDVSFHTHEHADHVDFELTRAFMERGKTVVVTDGLKQLWASQPWAERLVTLKQAIGQPRKVGNLDVYVLWDHQWNNDEHASGTPCNAYIITSPEGMSVATKGDINCGLQLYGWLNVLAASGSSVDRRPVDLMVGSPIYWHGVDLARQIDALLAPVWAPGHNWEFGHRPAGEPRGNASPFAASYSRINGKLERGSAVVLSWGEYLDIGKARGKRASK